MVPYRSLMLIGLAVLGFIAATQVSAEPTSDPAAPSSTMAPAPRILRVQVASPDNPTVESLQARIADQERKIVQLEAKVGLPSTMTGWTWFVIGLIGEGVFFLRFVVQWWASERKNRTVVPMMFWHLSLAGTALVLAYAVFVINPVFILAYSLNIFLYVRNLYIARHSGEAQPVE